MLRICNILAPIDFSECSALALGYARTIAKQFHAKLHVMYVADAIGPGGLAIASGYVAAVPGLWAELLDSENRRLEAIVAAEDRRDLEACAVFRPAGVPAREIADYALEAAIDLIVMGTHGRRGVPHVVMGSVAEQVVRGAPCPVLTVRVPSQPVRRRAEPAVVQGVVGQDQISGPPLLLTGGSVGVAPRGPAGTSVAVMEL